MNYYNEFDPKAAAWLRELIAAGHLPPGTVDERSIADVSPNDLRGFRQCHFFAGIGGWPYALRLAGWPDDEPVWTGSCPCQPFSCAGRGGGESDPRHLWPEFHRLIAECRPATVFGEQVASRAGREWLARVRTDLEGVGYAVGASDLCAAGVGAPHIRQRLFWVADAELSRAPRFGQHRREAEAGPEDIPPVAGSCSTGGMADAADRRHREGADNPRRRGEFERCRASIGMGDADDPRPQGREFRGDCAGERSAGATGLGFWSASRWHECRDGKRRRVPLEPALFPLAPGLPGRVGILRGAGNAIVPQVAAAFIEAFTKKS